MSNTPTMIETEVTDIAAKAEKENTTEIAKINEIFDRAEVRPEPRIEVITCLGDTFRILGIPKEFDKHIDPTIRFIGQPENVYTAMLMRYSGEKVIVLQGEGRGFGVVRQFTDVIAVDGSGITREFSELSAKQPVKLVWERSFLNRDNQDVVTKFEFTLSGSPQEGKEPKFVIEKSIRPAQVGHIGKRIPVARKNSPEIIR